MQSPADLYKYIPRHSPLQKLDDVLYKKHGVHLYFKRDDLLHPQFGGNKARKLYGHAQAFIQGKYNGWISWGGPWSNHLHAFAAFSHRANIPFHVIIRGNDLTYRTPLMDFIEQCGGHIHFVNREEYTQCKWGDISNLDLKGTWYAVPEGGGGNPGKIGCNLLAQEILEAIQPHRICLAIGTQTTLQGIAEKTTCAITGFSALKGWQQTNERIEITDEFCMGGYAKTSASLMEFILDFYRQHHILLDPVYTGKLMMGVHKRIARGNWDGETIVVIHSGGFQGIFGYPELLQPLQNLNSEILKDIYEVSVKK